MKELLESCINSACEIKTMENDLLTPARISAVSEEYGLSIEITSLDNRDLPAIAYNLPVKINIFNKEHGLISIGGNVFISNTVFWRITNIEKFGDGERRGFFRIRSSGRGMAYSVSGADPSSLQQIDAQPFKLVNVSLSGILIESNAVYNINDDLYVYDMVVNQKGAPFSAVCRVKRIDARPDGGILYGCNFEDLNSRESDRLCKAIFDLQREAVYKTRRRL